MVYQYLVLVWYRVPGAYLVPGTPGMCQPKQRPCVHTAVTGTAVCYDFHLQVQADGLLVPREKAVWGWVLLDCRLAAAHKQTVSSSHTILDDVL